jgi:uncharacterized protein YhhL (DUF1145 family)
VINASLISGAIKKSGFASQRGMTSLEYLSHLLFGVFSMVSIVAELKYFEYDIKKHSSSNLK